MSPKPLKTLPDFLARHRDAASVCANVAVIVLAYLASFALRFDFRLPPGEKEHILYTLPVAIALQYGAFYVFKITRGWWRYVGVADFLAAVKAAVSANLALAAFVLFFFRHGFPRSIFLINTILVIGLSIGIRLAVRLWREIPADRETSGRKRLLIIGAGDTGESLLRELRQSSVLNYQVVAFLDDDPQKQGKYINGVPVIDGVGATRDVVERLQIAEIIVATPSASGPEMRRIIDHCRAARVPFKVMPATWEVLSGRVTLGAAREVDINDLLRRPPVELDIVGIGRFLKGKRVLVTGAAGSIGSEICRQVLRFGPASLDCLDHDENALFFLERSLTGVEAGARGTRVDAGAPASTGAAIRYHLADVTDERRLDPLFGALRPQVIFHAAAHKHVPVLEANVVEGVRNNVFGTEVVGKLSRKYGAEAFVLISTDKAVNPTSVMGVTKRIAELLIQTLEGETRYTAVRFGNVLGSQGSVVPLLKEQIAARAPVTITHPDMKRYFMTIPEAVELVIQASALGKGNEIFLLDMGEPVRIVDLAHDLITLSGLRPDVDIPIVFTGVRPGEKLEEELYLDSEAAARTSHEKILVARHTEFDRRRFSLLLEELRAAVDRADERAVRKLLPQIVPEYAPQARGAKIIPLAAAAQK